MTSSCDNPKLDVLICTFSMQGMERVAEMDLPRVPGVRYVVSWQTAGADPSEIPAALLRDDVVVSPVSSVGSSNNRNHAIEVSTAPLCLTADDDLRYTAEQLLSVIDTFEKNPDIDLASFRYSGPDGKAYPSEEVALRDPLPKGFFSTSFEVAFRSRAVKGKIFYNPYFGINSPRLNCGDDGVFLLDCIHAGLNCRFFPVTVTCHPGLSSGPRLMRHPRFMLTQGAYIRYAYGWKGLPRVPLYAWRQMMNHNINFFRSLFHVGRGFMYKVPRGAGKLQNKG